MGTGRAMGKAEIGRATGPGSGEGINSMARACRHEVITSRVVVEKMKSGERGTTGRNVKTSTRQEIKSSNDSSPSGSGKSFQDVLPIEWPVSAA